MKATELMIGDYILHKSGVVAKVLALTIKTAKVIFLGGDKKGKIIIAKLADEVYPIYIDDGILEKDGWEKRFLNSVYFRKEYGYGRVFTLTAYLDPNLYGCYYLESGTPCKLPCIRTIHELQHALRLCGEEMIL